MSSSTFAKANQLLVSGNPGIGKTTLIRAVVQGLASRRPDLRVGGFYTREKRDSKNSRIGFEVVSVNDENVVGCLATSVGQASGPRVGKYTVVLHDFERIALPCFVNASSFDLLVLDELGKMEAFSKPFCTEFLRWLDATDRAFLLATIPLAAGGRNLPIVRAVTSRQPSNGIHTLTVQNRDNSVQQIIQEIDQTIARI